MKINQQPVPSTSLKRAKTSSMKSCRGKAITIKCRPAHPPCAGGIGSQHHRVMVLVILQHRICDRRELVAIMNVAIQIHRHHLGPFLHVLLLCRCELVLIFFRPAMKVINVVESERRFLRSEILRFRTAKARSRRAATDGLRATAAWRDDHDSCATLRGDRRSRTRRRFWNLALPLHFS